VINPARWNAKAMTAARLKMAYTPLPGWNWTIVGEVDKSVLLQRDAMRDRFLLAGVVLSAFLLACSWSLFAEC
jgi:hypothetical protein